MKNFLPDITQIPIRSPFLKRKKSCPLSGENSPKIDYKDTKLLKKYLSERGKIIPSRVTSVSAKKQRELTQAVKRARFMALLPYKWINYGSHFTWKNRKTWTNGWCC